VMNVEIEKSEFYSPVFKDNKLTPEEKVKVSDELKNIIANNIIVA